MSGRYLVACAVAVVAAACSSPGSTTTTTTTTSPPPQTPVPATTTTDAAMTAATPAPPCGGADHVLHGSTCCEVVRFSRQERFPGKVFLRCEGPQIGQPCTKKSDCDIACSCDGENPFHDRTKDPADGTIGVTGVCTGTRAIGVWMCDLDETGAVSHMIVD